MFGSLGEMYYLCSVLNNKNTMTNINQPLFETKAVSKATDQLMSVQTEQTITSLEVAELTGKRHDNVLADIRNILSQMEENNRLNFQETSYTDSRNRKQTCYSLTKEGCLCLVSGYDANLRMKIINRWKELEQHYVQQPQQATIQDKMFFINAVAEGLRLNEPSRLALYKQVNDQHCLGLSLPSYTPSKGVLKSLTDCLKEVGSEFSAKKFYPVLETGGYVERKSRFTHDGSMKHFWSLTKKGMEWGENQVNPNNPRETQPLFFADKFVDLYEGLLK